MTLTLGAAHVCSVPTVFTIARPVGLSVHLTGIPGYVPRDVGSPAEYHRLGRINLGNSLGYLLHQELATSPQLIYPIAPEFTLLSVNMVQGVVVTIDEIVSASSLMPATDPWDRNPQAWTAGAITNVVGALNSTAWTYTVPAGRKLYITHAEIWWTRYLAASSSPQVDLILNALGGSVLEILWYGNAVGEQVARATDGPIVLLPSTTIAYAVNVSSTSGGGYAGSRVSGLLFDA